LNVKALVLNQGYEPISICTARKALTMLLLLKAELIAARGDRIIRSAATAFPYPSVIRISSYIYVPHKNIDLSRKNILRRDGMRCQYCGSPSAPLTIDHIIPRSRGGGDTWENLTTACIVCNNRKGNRTPEEARMRLLTQPRKPNHVLFLRQYIGRVDESWKPYLFMD